jgi:Tol biopolymer transport system component
MRTFPAFAALATVVLVGACVPDHPPAAMARERPAPFEVTAGRPLAADPREVRLKNLRQLTTDGENAEAYWSFDGTRLSFQRTGPDGGCDQIYTVDLSTGDTVRVSTGLGRTTCAYFFPGDERILYASTHEADPACPARPDFSRGYVWAVYPGFDIFVADEAGRLVDRLTETPGYDAEATISPRGDRIVFTSLRDGDLDIYTMALDGSDVRRITNRLGYDGGAFFSPDGSKLVWRAHYPETPEAQADYRSLLADGLIRPTVLEIWVANADGSDAHQITSYGAASFAPFFHPSGDRIVFSSNMDDPSGRDFDLYMIGVDGEGLERITWGTGFDGFPMFSPDGRYLAFGSNRNESHPGNTNVFVAEWVEEATNGGSGGF